MAFGRRSPRSTLLWSLFALALAASPLDAQCSDGSQQPCESERRAAAAKAGNSVAVLYLDTRSRDSTDKELAAAVTEEMIEALGSDPRLDVRSHFVSKSLTKGDADPLTGAKSQHLGWLVSGSIRATTDSIELRVELTRVADQGVKWSQKFPQTRREFAALMSTMAGLIAGQITGRMLPQTGTARRVHRADPAAYILLVRARSYGRLYTEAGYRDAVGLLEQAIKIDSLYADAYASLAMMRFLWGDFNGGRERAGARVYAEKALALDPNNSDGLQALAAARWLQRDYSAQVESLARRGVALAPRVPESRLSLGLVLPVRGKANEAVSALRGAVAMDSLSPVLWQALFLRLVEAERYDEAIAARDHLVQLDPVGHPWTGRRAAVAGYRMRQRRCDESLGEARALADTLLLVRSLACLGKKEEARMIFDARLAKTGAAGDAFTWTLLGEADSALAVLVRAEARVPGSMVPLLMQNAVLAPYRKDARIIAALRRTGVEP